MRRISIAMALAAVLVLTGCVTSRQARNVTPGGFLGPSASLLEKGEKGEEALLVYHKRDTDWTSYDKVLLDPVAIWSERPSTLPPEQLADYQNLVDNFQRTLSGKLAKSYALVEVRSHRLSTLRRPRRPELHQAERGTGRALRSEQSDVVPRAHR